MFSESRSEVFGLRLSKLDRERLEFLARIMAKSPSTVGALILSDAVRARIHEMTAPPTAETDDGLDNARAI